MIPTDVAVGYLNDKKEGGRCDVPGADVCRLCFWPACGLRREGSMKVQIDFIRRSGLSGLKIWFVEECLLPVYLPFFSRNSGTAADETRVISCARPYEPWNIMFFIYFFLTRVLHAPVINVRKESQVTAALLLCLPVACMWSKMVPLLGNVRESIPFSSLQSKKKHERPLPCVTLAVLGSKFKLEASGLYPVNGHKLNLTVAKFYS